jgi:type I restriction enzyme R subunit
VKNSLTESVVEEAALTWFRELGYSIGHGPHMAPGELAAERDSFGDVVLVGRLRDAITRLNPTMIEETWAVISILETTAALHKRKCARE